MANVAKTPIWSMQQREYPVTDTAKLVILPNGAYREGKVDAVKERHHEQQP